LYVTSGELEWLNLYSGETHKLKYISELHATQGNKFSYKAHIIYQITGATPQKAIKLIARREPIIPNVISINCVRYKCSLFSLILPLTRLNSASEDFVANKIKLHEKCRKNYYTCRNSVIPFIEPLFCISLQYFISSTKIRGRIL